MCKHSCAGSKEGYRLYTLDHNTGDLRLDMEQPWVSASPPRPILPSQDQLCDSEVSSPPKPGQHYPPLGVYLCVHGL
jgi:hypothetical protein